MKLVSSTLPIMPAGAGDFIAQIRSARRFRFNSGSSYIVSTFFNGTLLASFLFEAKRQNVDQSDSRPVRGLIVLLVWPGRTSWSGHDKL